MVRLLLAISIASCLAAVPLRAAEATPTIGSIAPGWKAPGGPAFLLRVEGVELAPASVVRWNGQNRATAFVSATAIQAEIPASDIAYAGFALVSVYTPGLGVTPERFFQIAASPSAVPVIGSLSPSYIAPGGGGFSLLVNGANFSAQSVVRWNGAERATTFVSASQVRVSVTAGDVAAAGSALVRVHDPAGVSGEWLFPVTATAPLSGGSTPVAGSLNPSSVEAGSAGFTLQVRGANFPSQSVVRINGQARTTSYGGNSLLRAEVTAADVSANGSLAVTVYNPATAGLSGALTLTVTGGLPPAPAAPVSPSPSDRATDVSLTPVLSWTPSSGASSYDVYFGTASSPGFVANITGSSYAPGNLQPQTVYYWSAVARNAGGMAGPPAAWRFTTASIAAPSSGGYRFVPVAPCRVVDTRAGQGVSGAFGPPALTASGTREFAIPQGRCGIPSTARAYSLNVTVAPLEPLAYLSMWPSGQAQPVVSTLNSLHGGVVANAALVPAGANGAITVLATHRTDLILDINGYFETQGQNSFYTVNPCRLVDTRTGAGFTGAFGPPGILGGGTREFPLLAAGCGLSPANAYSLNVTVVPDEPLAYLTAWPSGGGRPLVSTLNAMDGSVAANAAIVPSGAGGAVQTFATHGTHVILDVNGYFGPAGFPNEMLFYPVTPCRVVDTRLAGSGAPAMGASETRGFPVGGRCGVPAGARAFSLNATVVPTRQLGYLTLWPAGRARPQVSTLNSFLGRITANAALTPAGDGGMVNVFVTDETHLILDVNGYFQ